MSDGTHRLVCSCGEEIPMGEGAMDRADEHERLYYLDGDDHSVAFVRDEPAQKEKTDV